MMVKAILYENPEKIQLSYNSMFSHKCLFYNVMVDGKHTNKFILVCACNKKLQETNSDIEEYYNECM